MLKIYHIKQISASILLYVDGKQERIEFRQGTLASNYHGNFATKDPRIQRAIEKSTKFGTLHTGQIYLFETIKEPEKKEDVKVVPEVVPEKKQQVTESNQMNFVQAKKHLIEKGVSPNDLKNFFQVKSQASKVGIEIIK
jgi:hypothetical protein